MPTRISDEEESNQYLLKFIDTHYINQTGDTMYGTLNMNRNKLTGLPTPSDPSDAVNKDFVDGVHRSTASKSYVDQKTRVYGFRLERTITATLYDVFITITTPNGINSNQIMLMVWHPSLRNIHYRGFIESGTSISTRTQFQLVFLQPKEIMKQEYLVTLEGLIYILPSSYLMLSGNSIELSLGNAGMEIT